MKHRLLANSINSNGGDISAERNIVRNVIEPLTDVAYEGLVTRRQLESFGGGGASVDPVFRELKVGDSVPVALSLPSDFNGKYQFNAMIFSEGEWRNYPAVDVRNGAIDLTTDGDGNVTDYYVNRIDMYGTPVDGINQDHILLTFTKA